MKNKQTIRFLFSLFGGLIVCWGLLVSWNQVRAEHISIERTQQLEVNVVTERRRGYVIEIQSSNSFGFGAAAEPGITVLSEDGTNSDEKLLINGETIPYIKTSEGYRIYHQPPEPDLLSAARSYIDTQPEKSE